MTKQSYQIIICKKSLYLSSPEPEPFLTKITAPAPAKYGGSTAPGSGSKTLQITTINHPTCTYWLVGLGV